MSEESGHRRTRTKSMMSFSGKNRMSLIFGKSEDESKEEKEAHKMHSKADPTRAINEAQPDAWSQEKSTMDPLRALQHRDAHGNIITDPDASNPTRPRLERPLDTIRSFEAAIDNSYSRRPISRAEPSHILSPQQRHSSYSQGLNFQNRQSVDGGAYYAGRFSSRPDSYIDNGNSSVPHNQGRRFAPGHRVKSDPLLYNNNGQGMVYPSHNYQQSYDTVASASVNGSGLTEQWGNSTDPSSENSSIDKVQQASKPELGETYGFNGFGGAPQFQGPILEEHGSESPAYGQPGYGHSHPGRPGEGLPFQGNEALPPVPPPHSAQRSNGPKTPIKLGSTKPTISSPPSTNNSEKRRGWLRRRFSKG